ncbi:sodium:proton antiporter [Massilia sp. BJB1822]|uniref:cation:proton antiporter n=1 Tax=Massilia sp. BJB1822 TaxID=2744470 RepID=UPI001594E543|nr:sodium:proton antiporter [Massilia sp. BJB1822]NVE00645.1 sodium:proton antiporter [Massilia sp. BJB1822]
MSVAHWALLIGFIFIAMMLVGTLLERLPLSGAMLYLGLGFLLGPDGVGAIGPDPLLHAGALELITEAALLISLFSVGLKLEVPLLDRRWVAPWRLALAAMVICVGLITAVGWIGLGLPLGAAILLGGILAPTDPVLASAIQSEPGLYPDPTRFSLSGEGALNDGTAFPFVLLGLGLMQLHELGDSGWRWWIVDLLWSTVGGVLIGAAIGALLGMLVIFLRTRHNSAVGLDEFLSLGVIAVSFGIAQICLASGFLSVFFAGLTLRRTRNYPLAGTSPLSNFSHADEPAYESPATHSHHASGTMTKAVLGFNEKLERLAELGIVLVIGAMLPYIVLFAGLWWFIPLLFVVIRPISVVLGFAGAAVAPHQLMLISWLGIRGIGSVYYLMFALRHGVPEPITQQLVALTLVAVTASILVHGVSAPPLMRWAARRDAKAAISDASGVRQK